MSLPERDDIHAIARELFAQMLSGQGGETPNLNGGSAARGSYGVARSSHGAARQAAGFISDKVVRAAKKEGKTALIVTPGTLVTPLARDAAWECGIELRYVDAIPREPNGKFRAVKSRVGKISGAPSGEAESA